MRYPLVLLVALALFQAVLTSGREEEEGVGYGKQKRETGSLLEAFSTLRKSLTDMSAISMGYGKDEVRERRESRFLGGKENPSRRAAGFDELIDFRMDDEPTLKGIRETAKELLSVIQQLKGDNGHDECKNEMAEIMKKIISLVLKLIIQLVNYIMNHIKL